MTAKIMIVDDEMMIRKYYVMLLESKGYTTLEAANGYEALEKILIDPCDVLMVDINMPKMDGLTMVKEIRSRDGFHHLPVIMISAEEGDADKDSAFEHGVSIYLQKPVKADLLLQSVAQLLIK
ncbi:MAG: response regulator [Zetaproteobacteria bacterium]|nr:response regulator [Zetaproteobacteria bacterium]